MRARIFGKVVWSAQEEVRGDSKHDANEQRSRPAKFTHIRRAVDSRQASPLGSQFDANTSLQSYQFLFGPEVAYRNRKVQLFGHGLLGANHTAVVWDIGSNNNPTLIGRTHFALGAGAGLDVSFNEHLAYRVFQADYIPTLVNGKWEKNYRVSTGIVVHF